jgi:hypothetical protein
MTKRRLYNKYVTPSLKMMAFLPFQVAVIEDLEAKVK